MRKIYLVTIILLASGLLLSAPADKGFSGPKPSCITPLSEYDILHYEIKVSGNWAEKNFHNSTGIKLKTLSRVDSITFDLRGMTVDSVFLFGERVTFVQDSSKITVFPEATVPADSVINIAINYHGSPGDGYFVRWNRAYRVFYSVFWASKARYFFPCVDHPADKATSELIATVPFNYKVASNGTLASVTTDSTDSTATYHWINPNPICTYNICFSSAPYGTLHDTTLSTPIVYYFYHYDSSDAVYDWGRTPQTIRLFDSLFGAYPFEKYGINTVPMGGAMEHQTMVSVNDGYINGHRSYEEIFAHELSHQWWGDAVGLANWDDFWLNEGMASYCEVIFTEHFSGEEAAIEYMRRQQNDYFGSESREGRFPIYDPEIYLSNTVYKKGSAIFHMLRFVLGDSLFFNSLQQYYRDYKYKTVTTDSLIATVESVSDSELTWFFEQWVYDSGYPEIDYTYEVSDTFRSSKRLKLITNQVQTDAPIFTTPLVIRKDFTTTSLFDTLWIDSEADTFYQSFPDSLILTNLTLNPEDWILMKSEEVSPVKERNSTYSNEDIEIYPNPVSSELNINIHTDGNNTGEITLMILDVNGNIKATYTRQIRKSIKLKLPSSLKSGFYFLKGEREGQKLFRRKFIVFE